MANVLCPLLVVDRPFVPFRFVVSCPLPWSELIFLIIVAGPSCRRRRRRLFYRRIPRRRVRRSFLFLFASTIAVVHIDAAAVARSHGPPATTATMTPVARPGRTCASWPAETRSSPPPIGVFEIPDTTVAAIRSPVARPNVTAAGAKWKWALLFGGKREKPDVRAPDRHAADSVNAEALPSPGWQVSVTKTTPTCVSIWVLLLIDIILYGVLFVETHKPLQDCPRPWVSCSRKYGATSEPKVSVFCTRTSIPVLVWTTD